jgi:hypothetical protein
MDFLSRLFHQFKIAGAGMLATIDQFIAGGLEAYRTQGAEE